MHFHSTPVAPSDFFAPVTPDATPAPPSIPDYELLRLVGRGSYGDVWLARGVTGVFRAVKIVWRERFEDALPYEREFRGLKEFAAVSIVEARQLALLHVGRNDGAGFFYYVMELADDVAHGREIDPATYVPNTLREVRTRRGRLPAAEVVALGAELARGLAGLHTHNLVHRDIKPSNVIIVGGAPKLADIGLVATASAALTFVGTEGYVPPEGPGAPAADVFSLGKLLYELATGLDRHDYPRLPAEFAALPDRKELLELNEVLIRACEPDARKRHTDATVLLDELLLLQAGRSVRRLRSAERRLSRALRIAAALALIATVAGSGAFIEHRRAAVELQRRHEAEAERDDLKLRTVYAANIAQAQRAIERDDFGRARQLLASATPPPGEGSVRGFEWRALQYLARGDPCTILRENGPPIARLAVSPDGALLAVHDKAQSLTLYDTDDNHVVRRIEDVYRFAGFSSDGRWLIGAESPIGLQRWGVADGGKGGAPAGRWSRLLAPAGPNRVAVFLDVSRKTGAPAAVAVWDFAESREVARVLVDEGGNPTTWGFFCGASAPNGTEAVIGFSSGSGSTMEFRLSHFILSPLPQVRHQIVALRPGAIGWLPESSPDTGGSWWVADERLGRVLTLNRTTDTWDDASSRLPAAIALSRVSSPESGEFLVAADRAKLVQRPLSSGTPVREFRGHPGLVSNFAISAPRARLFSASETGDLRAWSVAPLTRDPSRHQAWNSRTLATSLVFSSDSRHIFVPEEDNGVGMLTVADLRPERAIPEMQRPLAATPDGVWGLDAANRALIRWSATTGTIVETLAASDITIADVQFSSRGDHACLRRVNGELSVLSLRDGQTTVFPGKHERTSSFTMDDAGQRMFFAEDRTNVSCLPASSAGIGWTAQTRGTVAAICFVSSRNVLAAVLENGELQLFDAQTGRLTKTLSARTVAGEAVAVTPDQRRLVVAGFEGDLQIFETATWEHFGTVPLKTAVAPHTLAISPDGRAAALLTKAGMLHVARAD